MNEYIFKVICLGLYAVTGQDSKADRNPRDGNHREHSCATCPRGYWCILSIFHLNMNYYFCINRRINPLMFTFMIPFYLNKCVVVLLIKFFVSDELINTTVVYDLDRNNISSD